MTQKRAAVIGFPVKHSKSPLIHNYWMEKYKIDGLYEAVEVSAENLQSLVQKMVSEGFCGFNVTVPHKVSVFNLLDEISDTAKKAGAVNTVVIRNDKTLFGDNTDGFGFVANVKESCPDFDFTGKTAVVLGSGGASRGICAALSKEGCKEIRLVCRSKEKGEALVRDVGGNFVIYEWIDREKALTGADFLANATTLGMDGFDGLDISLDSLNTAAVVADAVYVPLETKLLKQAREKGFKTADGLGMLLHQAAGAFKLWFGFYPDVTDELRRIVSK